MSHFNPGLISAYNSLTDKHLAGYFSSTRIRRHLQRAGLITRSGRIVPEKEYRHKLIQRAHQRHVRECLAQAIFHKVLEMERLHQIEIKRRLEEFARRERVHKIKVECSKRYEEEIRILSPRPPTGARAARKQHSGRERDHSESSESPGSSRPNTAPGKMQRPVRLKPIHSSGTAASLRRSSPYRLHESSNENNRPFNSTMDKESRRHRTTTEASFGVSPYCLPVINNFVTPVPPATKRKERGVRVTPSSTLRGRRLRPATASSGADVNEELPILRSSAHQSRVCVSMVYFGKTVHLSHDLLDMRDEVKVFQQHCGGENLCVYKGKLREGERFQFISRRHRGFPFSLTFFLNGLQVERLSSCCEFKHRKGSRLGGRHGHFGFASIDGASPCYKCIIAMGLDKKPSPPPKRVREDVRGEETVSSSKDTAEMEMEMGRTVEDAASHSESETSPLRDTETPVREERAPEQDNLRDDYEEDFEADDEGPAEDAESKEKRPSSPPSELEAKEREASETEDDEKDEDGKSHSGSSSASSDGEESDAEDTKDNSEDKEAEQPEEVSQEGSSALPDQKDEAKPGEAAAIHVESVVAKDSDIQDNVVDGTESKIPDNNVASGNENIQTDDTSGDKEEEKPADESKQEEEQERVKSVQEKPAGATLEESRRSSEPQLSETMTEESPVKGHEQDNEDTAPERSGIMREEGVSSEAEVVQDNEQKSEPKEDEGEEKPIESPENSQTEMVKIKEDVEKDVTEEDMGAAGQDKPEDVAETDVAPHRVSEEKTAEDDKASAIQDDTADEATDAEAAEKDEESEAKPVVKADTHAGQGAKYDREDESSLPDLNKKTDETAEPDTAEEEEATGEKMMEKEADHSEEPEALSCEVAPVTDTERQREDGEDIHAASETEVTANKSGSSSEGSGETAVPAEKTADTNEAGGKSEGGKDDRKEEEDEGDAERGGEDAMEEHEEAQDKTEKQKSEEEGKEDKLTDELPSEKAAETGKSETDNMEEEEGSEKGKEEESIENEENIKEVSESQSSGEGKSNKEFVEEDVFAKGEKAGESENTEKDEGDGIDEEVECVKSKDGEVESDEKGGEETYKGDEINKTDANDDKADEAEESRKDENDEETEESISEMNKDNVEEIISAAEIVETQEKSEITEEPEKISDQDKDSVQNDENFESEDAGDREAAHDSNTTEEMLNKTDAEKTMRAEECDGGERGEVDAESGERPSKTNEDSGRTSEHTEDRKTDQSAEKESIEVKKESVESEDAAERNDEAEQASDKLDGDAEDGEAEDGDGKDGDAEDGEAEDGDGKDGDAEDGDAIEEKQEDSEKKGCEPSEIKDESKSDYENTEKGDSEAGDGENIQLETAEVVSAAIDSPAAAHKVDSGEIEPDESDQNAAGAIVHAIDGQNGAETEEASKASEEGASVLLKPHEQPEQPPRNGNVEKAADAASPESLAEEDNGDLVINWVTMHQASKYFETFVEPLEDLRDSSADAQVPNAEATQSAEPPSQAKTVRMSDGEAADAGNEQMPKDVHETESKTVQATDGPREEPGEGVKHLSPNTENEPDLVDPVTELTGEDLYSRESEGSSGSPLEAEVQDAPAQRNATETDVFATEVESIADTHHSAKPESVAERQTEERNAENEPDSREKRTEEVKSLPSPLGEEHRGNSGSQDGLSKVASAEQHVGTWEQTDDGSQEVTEITDFTASKSDVDSRGELRRGETEHTPSDGSVAAADRGDVQLIRGIKHTLSKGQQSAFSVDGSLFGHSSHPLLTAARAESGQ